MTFLFSKTERYILNLIKECKQPGRLKKIKSALMFAAVLLVGLVLFLTFSFSGIAVLSEVQAKNYVEPSAFKVPPEVYQDALTAAVNKYSQTPRSEEYARQLISGYKKSIDKDFLIIFSAGGWGSKTLGESAHWISIISGMQSQFEKCGYKTGVMCYQRTQDDIRGQLYELKEMVTGYIEKADDFAGCVNFVTDHNPKLRVILAGESTGTMICDSAMNLLKDNQNVYSIQTGSPFWQKNTIRERTLVVNDNGVVPDAFAKGDLFAVVRSSLNSLIFGEEEEGDILLIFSAPGHQYWWQNPGVCSEINKFLSANFGVQPDFPGSK
jgi:hypothetical protein